MRMHPLLTVAALGLVLAAPVQAQQDPAGLPFAGCWTSADGISTRNRICLAPTATAMMEFSTVAPDGKVTESQLSLDGQRVAVKSGECEGWEEGRLTSDGERILVKAEITCGREPKQMRSTTFSITPAGYLLQATGAGLAMIANTQIRIFAPVESYADVPPAIRESLMPYLVSAERARLGVRENAVSAADLIEFERLEVAAPLIDVMVAASYPKSFVIDGLGGVADAGGQQGQLAPRQTARANPFVYMNGYPMLSAYDWQMMYECSRIGLGCPYGAYGYSPYGYYGYGSRYYGYGAGYGGYGGYWPGYGIPVIVRPVVTPAPSGGSSGGRAVRGRGYTQTGSSSGGTTAQPRTGGASTANTQGGGGSSSGGSAGSSSSGGGSARTAKPRP